jgi:cell wall-associated NlpC family hydrolase
MQINSVHSDLLGKFDWKDPQQNMNMAFQIYQGAGNSFSPWSTFNSGTYNKFLGAAKTAAAVVPANIPSYVTQTPTGLGQVIVSDAKAYLGLPYVWSGGQGNGPTTGGNPNGPLGFDCSGLVQSVYAQVGIKLPRTADQQAHYGTRTSISALQPGDLVAWQGGYRGPNYVGHIAIYIGNGQIEEAPFTGANVRIRSLRPDENVFGVHITSVNT